MVWLKPASLRYYLPSHSPFFALLALLWLIVSLINGKMNRGKIINLKSLFVKVITSNIISLGLAILIVYTLREFFYSRMVVFGTVLLATGMELIAGIAFLAVRKAVVQDNELPVPGTANTMPSEVEMVGEIGSSVMTKLVRKEINDDLFRALSSEAGEETANGVLSMIEVRSGNEPVILSTGTIFNITTLPKQEYKIGRASCRERV